VTTRLQRIAVLRALPGLGDLLCAVPALRALRVAHPEASITLVGLARAGWFVARFSHLVDHLLVLEGVSGLPEITPDPEACRRFVVRARARQFDLALQLHGSGVASNAVLELLGARRQGSAHLPGQAVPRGTSVPYPPGVPEIHRLLAVVAAVGCPPQGDELELPLEPVEERIAARMTAGALAATGGYTCLHPGASRPERCWSPRGFAAVADHLVGLGRPVLLTGSVGDREQVAAMRRAMTAEPELQQRLLCDVTGCTSVGVLGALYGGADLVVTNDTGASHVAVAVKARSVVVGGFHEPGRWEPLDRERHRAIAVGNAEDVMRVLGAVDEQLNRGRALDALV